METSLLRAAEYMRVSTEHQQYSIANQSAAIQEYANTHSIEIVRTYVDRGKSGLRLAGRTGLNDLLNAVKSGAANFSVLLVYDVSRWGRFQDVDESAYHEYGLKRAGVSVIYCAEPFRDNGSPTDALLKTLKRTMAAEYSRELSTKVSAGQRRIAQSGYRLGGVAGFGFRRMAIDPTGTRRMVLADGERKGVKTDRMTLVHGPREEIRAVRKIFSLFVREGFSEGQIAKHLGDRGSSRRSGSPWRKKAIHDLLTNPKYVGDLVYNRTSINLGSSPVNNPREQWTYLPDRFEPIISRDIWNRARSIFEKRAEHGKNEDMLSRLGALLKKHGRLCIQLIDSEKGMCSSQTYKRRFGSLIEAYRLVGWTPERDYRQIGKRPDVHVCQQALELAITARIAALADTFSKDPKTHVWIVNGEMSICVALVVATKNESKRLVWKFPRGAPKPRADVLVIARLNVEANAILDYYVFPGDHKPPIRIFEQNAWALDIHRFEDMRFIDLLCRRANLPETGLSDV